MILFLFESAIPRPLPWLKPGLSNLVIIIALFHIGGKAAFLVMFIRVVAGALILGSLFSPVFIFSLCGGILATSVMVFLQKKYRNIFSIIGISLAGSFTHNLVQLLLAAFLVISSRQVLTLMPIMLLSSLFSGFLVGIFAHFIIIRLEALSK